MASKNSHNVFDDIMKNNWSLVLVTFFIALMAVGLNTYDDYGISWDEYRNRINGYFTLTYVAGGDPALFDYQDRHYGTAFELPLVILEKIIKLETFRSIFLMRHLATFLFFYVSCIAFYFLCRDFTRSRAQALVALGMLVISPRIFTNAFYNSKDIVFMGMFVISIYSMTVFMKTQSPGRTLLHAAACGFLTGIRVAGVMVPFLTILWLAARSDHKRDLPRTIINGGFFLIAFACFTILFWPYLWHSPVRNLASAFSFMGRHPNIIHTLYLGENYSANALPWHYLIVWMLVTIPPAYSFLFFTGLAGTTGRLIKNIKSARRPNSHEVIILIWFFGPITLAILMQSTLYDGWRQLFFIYPAFVLMGVKGLKMLWRLRALGSVLFFIRSVLVLAMMTNMTAVVWFMVKYHPNGNVYFNFLAGREYRQIEKKFEMDFWGLAYRNALEKILTMDDRDKIVIFAANDPGVLNSLILPEPERRRIWYVTDARKADYYITNHRWQKADPGAGRALFTINVKGAAIVSVYKLDQAENRKIDPGPFKGNFFDYFNAPGRYLAP